MLALTCACATFSSMAGAAGEAPVIKQNVRVLSEPPASYPEAAKAAGHQGVVKLRLSIDSEDKPVAIKVVAPIKYVKDSILDLANKACSDLNVDVSWFRSVHPDKPVSDMNIYNLSLGLLAMAAGSAPKILETSRKFSKAFDKTVERCAQKPDEKYWENIKSGMSAWF